MAARKTPVVTQPVTLRLPKGVARPSTCGAHFATFGDVSGSAEGCKRLPRHHGDHVEAKPRGLMTKAQRQAARVTKVAVPKGQLVTIGGTKYRAIIAADGSVSLTPVTTKSPEAPEASPVTKVRQIAPSKRGSRRRVAAPAKVTKPGRGAHMSGQPSARLA